MNNDMKKKIDFILSKQKELKSGILLTDKIEDKTHKSVLERLLAEFLSQPSDKRFRNIIQFLEG